MKKILAICLTLLLLLLAGCGTDNANNGAAAAVVQIESVDDLIAVSDVIVMAEYIGEYETVGRGNGVITIGNTTFDDTSYYGLCDYKVLRVVQGDEKLLGQTITVREYLGVGEDALLPMAEARVQHDAELYAHQQATGEQGSRAWKGPDRLMINPKRLLLCMKYDAEEGVYSVPIPEKCINTVTYENDIIHFTTKIEGSEKNIPLESFKNMVKTAKK